MADKTADVSNQALMDLRPDALAAMRRSAENHEAHPETLAEQYLAGQVIRLIDFALPAVLQEERKRCTRLICEPCRLGMAYNRDTNGHGKVIFQECKARAIWDTETVEKFAAYLDANTPELLGDMRQGLTAEQMRGANLATDQLVAKAVNGDTRDSLPEPVKEAWQKFLRQQANARRNESLPRR